MSNLNNPYKGKCPDCTDGLLQERVNKATKNTFLGCSEWPECVYTERGGENPTAEKNINGEYSPIGKVNMLGNIRLELNSHVLVEGEDPNTYSIQTVLKLHTPAIHTFSFQRNEWGEWYRQIGFQCPTSFVFHKSECFWYCTLVVIGFGIGISHQNGY